MAVKKFFLVVGVILFLLQGCSYDDKYEKYERPEWLAGKVYTQILQMPELSVFAKCIKRIGYDTILDVSGSYTVFAPSDDAWKEYLAEKTPYDSIEQIPLEELRRIVKYHIIQNAWSKIQLRTLDVFGWIDTLDPNNDKPRGFKRETLLKEENRKYGVASYKPVGEREDKVIIVDTNSSHWYRRVITDSRKYVPIFYQEYFDIYHLDPSDYTFYFGRTFDGGDDLYYAGAKIVSDEIFAENGFIYVIDKVVEPLNNGMEMIYWDDQDKKYSHFLAMVNLFPQFEYNEKATFEQPGAEEGLEVDSLFDLSFPDLAFDLNLEKTSPPTGTYGLPENVTVRYHHGLMAPVNSAFDNFIDEYIRTPEGWGSLANTPDKIKRIIVNSYFSFNTIYPSDFEKGFYNGENDLIFLSESDILEKKFGSNCSFLGLNKAIVPRAFKSVTGPVYLRKGYSKVMYAIEKSGLLPALKKRDKDYMFFVESDINTDLDSSLFYDQQNDRFFLYLRTPGSGGTKYNLSIDDLRTLLLNQVAVHQPTGIPRKEFIPNLAGNYIIVNNETGEVSGTAPTTDGYLGLVEMPEFPVVLSNQVDNGITYDVKNWFSFSGASLYMEISTKYPRFHELLRRAGLSSDNEYLYTFVSDNEFYTVFIPTDEALDSAHVDDMTDDELRDFLLFHFVQGSLIFTDGSSPPGYYETVRLSENSTEFTKLNTKVYIDPGIDRISFPAADGSEYAVVEEAEGKTNDLTVVVIRQDPNQPQGLYPRMYNNAVIHSIDKVLDIEKLKVQRK